MKLQLQAIIFSCLAIATLSVNSYGQCANSANIYSFTYLGETYQVVKELKTWKQAAACAVTMGGKIVEINDQAEQTAVYNGILAAGISTIYHPVSDGGGTSYIWTGATDKFTEGRWIWDGDNNDTGTNFWNGQGAAGTGGGAVTTGSYVNWGGKSTGTIQEPDDYGTGQDAAGIALASWPYGIAGEWNDIDTANTLYYVVEYSHKLGIETYAQSETLHVYPNPANHNITVSIPAGSGDNLCIVDLAGRQVGTYPINNQRSLNIDILALPEGTYIIYANGEHIRFVK